MRLTLALFTLVSCATPPEPLPAPKLTAPELRLPDSVRPAAYQVSLRVVPGEDTVTGEMTIAANVLKATDVIWLNGEEMAITHAELTLNGQGMPARADVANRHFIALTTGQPIPAGPVVLKL